MLELEAEIGDIKLGRSLNISDYVAHAVETDNLSGVRGGSPMIRKRAHVTILVAL